MTKKAKKISFDPIASLKSFPQEFWLKVPTYDQSCGSDFLKDRGRVKGEWSTFRPKACEEFPEYAEFYDKFRNIKEHFAYELGAQNSPIHDWVEYTINGFTFRLEKGCHSYCKRGFTHTEIDGWRLVDDAFMLNYGSHMNGELANWSHTHEGKKLYNSFERADKKVANTWNRLRKQARRKAGVELTVDQEAKKKAEERLQKVKLETELCVNHIDELIDALAHYRKECLEGLITRDETSKIFNMTNEMTARGAALRDALAIKK